MEIIIKGTDDVSAMSLRGCCYPLGTESMRIR